MAHFEVTDMKLWQGFDALEAEDTNDFSLSIYLWDSAQNDSKMSPAGFVYSL